MLIVIVHLEVNHRLLSPMDLRLVLHLSMKRFVQSLILVLLVIIVLVVSRILVLRVLSATQLVSPLLYVLDCALLVSSVLRVRQFLTCILVLLVVMEVRWAFSTLLVLECVLLDSIVLLVPTILPSFHVVVQISTALMDHRVLFLFQMNGVPVLCHLRPPQEARSSSLIPTTFVLMDRNTSFSPFS